MKYASIRLVGENYGMSRSTLYRAVRAGHIKAVKCGRLTRICLASVDRYFASLPQIGYVGETA